MASLKKIFLGSFTYWNSLLTGKFTLCKEKKKVRVVEFRMVHSCVTSKDTGQYWPRKVASYPTLAVNPHLTPPPGPHISQPPTCFLTLWLCCWNVWNSTEGNSVPHLCRFPDFYLVPCQCGLGFHGLGVRPFGHSFVGEEKFGSASVLGSYG